MTDTPFPKPDADTCRTIDNMLKDCRRQILERGEVVPAAMILHDGGVEVVLLDLQTSAEKERTGFMIRELVKLYEAHTVVLVSEMWTLPAGTKPAEAQALIERYGRVAAMPNRVEAVHVAIETRAGVRADAQAAMLRNGRMVKLGPPIYRDLRGYDSYGNLADFFSEYRPVPEDLTKVQS